MGNTSRRVRLALFMALCVYRPLLADSTQQLLEAASKGDVAEVELVLAAGADVNASDRRKATALHCAAGNGHADVVILLLGKGADARGQDRSGATALYWAVQAGHASIVELLVKRGAGPRSLSEPLRAAVESGHKDAVDVLLRHGANVNGVGRSTPLDVAPTKEVKDLLRKHGARSGTDLAEATARLARAVTNGNTAELADILSKGEDVDLQDEGWNTPLHIAAFRGRRAAAELLLNKGASVNARNWDGWSPLHKASLKGHREVARLLIDRGARVNDLNEDGRPALYYAPDAEMAKLLLDRGAEVRPKGMPPDGVLLQGVADDGDVAFVKLLLSAGADPNAADQDGQTPLHWVAAARALGNRAPQEEHARVAELLAAAGANVNARDVWGGTPLHSCAGRANTVVAGVLLSKGADCGLASCGGETPLQAAVGRPTSIPPERRLQFIEFALSNGAPANASGTRGMTPLDVALEMCSAGNQEQIAAAIRRKGGLSSGQILVAAREGDIASLHGVLDRGNLDNAYGRARQILLHQAAAGDQHDLVRLLIEKGAKVNVKDALGQTPLDLATSNDMKSLLRKHGGKPGAELE